jgi:hypothetical protein
LKYSPGKCNIGAEEISRRYRIGYFGVGLTLIGIALITIYELPRTARLAIFLPVGIALVGFVQATARFCLAYGLRGVFSIEGRRKLSPVVEHEAISADRRQAWKIVFMVLIGSILITTIYYFFP